MRVKKEDEKVNGTARIMVAMGSAARMKGVWTIILKGKDFAREDLHPSRRKATPFGIVTALPGRGSRYLPRYVGTRLRLIT